jgi:hypothetical protein
VRTNTENSHLYNFDDGTYNFDVDLTAINNTLNAPNSPEEITKKILLKYNISKAASPFGNICNDYSFLMLDLDHTRHMPGS